MPLQRLANGFDKLSGGAGAHGLCAERRRRPRAASNRPAPPAMVALLQDIGRGDDFDAAFERRMLTTYASFAASLDPSR